MPRSSEPSDHNVEPIFVGGRDAGEEKIGIVEVLEVNDFAEKEVGFVNGMNEQLGVDLLDLFGGNALLQVVYELLSDMQKLMLWVMGGFKGEKAGSLEMRTLSQKHFFVEGSRRKSHKK